MSDFNVFHGIEHLPKLGNNVSIAFDTETLQLQPELGKLRLIQLGSLVNKAIVVIDCWELDTDDWQKLKLFFTNGERFWCAHNAVFDIAWLQEHGIYLRGRVACTMLASKIFYNGIPKLKHNLKDVAKRVLKIDVDKEEQKSDWGAINLTKEQLDYAARDVEVLMQLDIRLTNLLQNAGLAVAFQLECGALPAMAQMWRTGLPWNRASLRQLLSDYKTEITDLGGKFLLDLDEALPDLEKLPRIEGGEFNLRPTASGSVKAGTRLEAGFNLNSPKQLLHKFTILLGKPPFDSKTKKPSTSKAALKEYAADHAVIRTYLAWKKTEKRRQMANSMLEALHPDGFVRASYLQLGAESGRMSCMNPNNQQIPRDERFRQCVEAPSGWMLVDADFGQMELRIAACVAKDERMTQAFQNGEDLHTVTADALGCSRQVSKSANFGLLYGSGAKGLRDYAAASGVALTIEEATKIRRQWLDTYSGIKAWQGQCSEDARAAKGNSWPQTEVPVSNLRRYLPGDMNRLTVRCNTPIQGAGAAVLKCSLGRLWPKLKAAGEDEVKLSGCIHDEIILLVREDKASAWAQELKQIMEGAEALWLGDVPPLAEPFVGKRWSDVH